ncbi:MAG: c-type cytochrome [Sulfuricaulis sp.]|nr:c-type cytochrome [Sulfuricaulis sp.]
MRRTILSILVMAGLFLSSATALAAGQEVEKLYQRHCTACHGEKGDGDGPAAYLLSPKPRDFTRGVYKFRSTPTGSPPTDQDLLRTLKHGVPGTSMPPWDRLSEKELTDVIKYVKSFSDIFADQGAMEPPIAIKSPPRLTKESVQAGRKVYKEMECNKCHGPRGRGDGPSAAKLTDDWERPIRPYDFTRGPGLMKGGAAPQDIYRTFMTGLDGTPMPSFIDELTEKQRWQLVHYIQSLSPAGTKTTAPESTPTLRAVKASVDPPLDSDDPVWKQSPATVVPLRPLWARDTWVDSVKVQTVIGPKMAAFRFEWRDIRGNDEVIRPRDFRDGIAMQYIPQGKPSDYVGIPFIGMGDDKDVVTIWHWKADWEADMKKGFRDVVQKYGVTMDRMTSPADHTSDRIYLAGLAAANPLSTRQHSTPVEVLAAKGFGTLTSLSATDQTVEGRGVWRNGVWVVVMRQTLDSAPALRQRKILPVAIAAWDGDAGDRNGQKSVSQWMELTIE